MEVSDVVFYCPKALLLLTYRSFDKIFHFPIFGQNMLNLHTDYANFMQISESIFEQDPLQFLWKLRHIFQFTWTREE